MTAHIRHKWSRWGKVFEVPGEFPGIERPKSAQERECTKCGQRIRRIIGTAPRVKVAD